MSKARLVSAVAEAVADLSLSKRVLNRVTSSVIESIRNEVVETGRCTFQEFGTLKVITRAARAGRVRRAGGGRVRSRACVCVCVCVYACLRLR
jgi:nucleoid DNA-binding protein